MCYVLAALHAPTHVARLRDGMVSMHLAILGGVARLQAK